MSVKLELLPREELLLLDAVEGMEFQYSVVSLQPKSLPILGAYGFPGEGPEEARSARFSQFMDLVSEHQRQLGYWTGNRFSGDHKSLNKRSKNLLVLLAGLSKEAMGNGDEALDHLYMSAGEAACFQLASYELLTPAPGGGSLNPEGHKLARYSLSKEFAPITDFTFEDIG